MSSHAYWWTALLIGLLAALVVAGLLALLLQAVVSIDRSVRALLTAASHLDPGNYRLHLKIGGRYHTCAAAALFPHAQEAGGVCR